MTRYYAVALGRKQTITTDYREYRKLVNGYPNAKHRRFEDYWEAHEYIERFNNTLKYREASNYEVTETMRPSFTNKLFNGSNIKESFIWISYLHGRRKDSTHIDDILNIPVKNVGYENSAVSATVKTLVNLEESVKETDICRLEIDYNAMSEINNEGYEIYNFTSKREKDLYNNAPLLKVETLTEILTKLHLNGVTETNIITDSHYLLHIVTRDIFNSEDIRHSRLKNSEQIYDLYYTMSKFNRIYISRYNAKTFRDGENIILNINHNRCVDLVERG